MSRRVAIEHLVKRSDRGTSKFTRYQQKKKDSGNQIAITQDIFQSEQIYGHKKQKKDKEEKYSIP